MDLKGRDRTGTQGFRIGSGAADLIGDIHRQQRRRVLRRAAQVAALAFTLLLIGIAFKVAADRRDRAASLEVARVHFLLGGILELGDAIDQLESSLDHDPDHRATKAALALVRAQLAVEFGEAVDAAHEAVGAVDGSDMHDAVVSRGLLALERGDIESARAAVEEATALGTVESIAPEHEAWLAAMIARAGAAEDPQALLEVRSDVEAAVEAEPDAVAYRRALVGVLIDVHDGQGALQELARLREQSRSHMGLAADEALYNAYLRQELTGVADVADQLLAAPTEAVGRRDRARALLARGVVHVQTGEVQQGLEKLDAAWTGLPSWDRLARELALQAVLEAGDGTRSEAWMNSAGLGKVEAGIYAAWGRHAQGDLMGSLALLAELPQDHPRVAYLQALALVEQGRFAEAAPWLDRSEKLLPGRIEIEVARARTQLRLGDKEAGLEKLRTLAEEEPFAPRAWTGLGEGYLLQDGEVDLRKAQKSLERAIEREPVPAEAMLRLAEVWQRKRGSDLDAEKHAFSLMERCAETNPHVPRYRQELALYLADLGYKARARALLGDLVDVSGVEPAAILRLVELVTDDPWSGQDPGREEVEQWIAKAAEAGASDSALVVARARLDVGVGDNDSLQAARRALDALIEQKPDDVAARVLYSRAALKQFDREAAELTVRRGLQVTADAQHAPLYLEWARIESRTGKRQSAAAHARVAWLGMLDQDRTPAELLEAADLAANLWVRQQKPKVALSITKQLTDRLAHHSAAWTIRAFAELAGNKSAEARASIERAIDLDDRNARAHELHGHTLLRFGYKDRAREAYERAIDLVKGTPDEKAYRDNLRRL